MTTIPCPDCGHTDGTPGVCHGAPNDTSLSGLLCTIEVMARELRTGEQGIGQQAVSEIITEALDRFNHTNPAARYLFDNR